MSAPIYGNLHSTYIAVMPTNHAEVSLVGLYLTEVKVESPLKLKILT